MHHLSVIKVACMIMYWVGLRRRKQKNTITRDVRVEGEIVRSELMTRITTNDKCRSIIRMSPAAFVYLCDLLAKEGGLRPIIHISIEEKVVKTLYLLAHSVTNREIDFFFYRSGETISQNFHNIIRDIIELEDKFLKQPDGSEEPSEIFNSNQFYPYFKVSNFF